MQQIIGSQNAQQNPTVVPLTLTSRPTHTSLGGTLPVATNISHNIVRGNVNIVTSANSNSNTSNVVPIAKVLPQQQNVSNDPPAIVSVGNSRSKF